jgi:hypothetical protein
MGDLSFQNNAPDPLLAGKELPAFKLIAFNSGIYESISFRLDRRQSGGCSRDKF